MKYDEWKERLALAVENSGKSMRAVSLASGKGPGYIHALLKEDKEPTLSSLMAICKELNISTAYLIYGQDFSRLDERFLEILSRFSDEEKAAILNLLESFSSKR